MRGLHLRGHAQPVAPEASVGLARRIHHLQHDDRLIARDITAPERAIALIMIEPLAASIAAAYVLAMAIAIDHDTPHFGIALGVDRFNRDLARPLDHILRNGNAMAVPERPAIAVGNRRPRIAMQAACCVAIDRGWAIRDRQHVFMPPDPATRSYQLLLDRESLKD